MSLFEVERDVELQVTNTLLLCMTNYFVDELQPFYSKQLAQYDYKVTFFVQLQTAYYKQITFIFNN